jgi:homoserine dehydrogenase
MANAAPALVRIGVVGHGTVGAAFTALVARQAEHIEARTGVRLVVTNVAVRNVERHRSSVGAARLTADPLAVVNAADVDLVVEVMGGTTVARDVVAAALKAGKPVVTANKALLAAHSAELFALADEAHTDLLFEAAVCGGIPLIRPLRESLRGEPIRRVLGIVNGTTNYILTKMTQEGSDYASALAGAQTLGYAEADPTADVEGYDAAAKAAILASIAFHTRVTADDVYREGITKVSPADFDAARALGCTIKLLAICERINDDGQQRVSARVYPALVPLEHPLATVNGAFNAVVVEAEAAGRLMFYGQGAGGNPTASAVMGDVVMAARNRVHGGRGPRESRYAQLPIAPIGIIPTRYYVSMTVKDRPGVLAAVATEFGRREVSIAELRQDGLVGEDARIVVVTHRATDSALSDTVAALAGLDVVDEVTSVLRLEGTAE